MMTSIEDTGGVLPGVDLELEDHDPDQDPLHGRLIDILGTELL